MVMVQIILLMLQHRKGRKFFKIVEIYYNASRDDNYKLKILIRMA